MRRIYFDHNATTPVDAAVLAEMLPYLGRIRQRQLRARVRAERAGRGGAGARASGRVLIGAQAPEIVFTSGGTESDNAAICGRRGSGGGKARATGRELDNEGSRHHVGHRACRGAAHLQALARRSGEGGAESPICR